MEKFDLVVIGAGPSGYAAAMRAVDFKRKTLLIEKSKVGGAGITNGALSSKTWWELSRETASFRKNLRRFNLQAPSINYKEIQAEVRKAVDERKSMLENHIVQMEKTNLSHLLTFRTGKARLLSENEIEISSDRGIEVVSTDYVILSTGSRHRNLPELKID
jgi:dihydrolipoamide dehydrogenase